MLLFRVTHPSGYYPSEVFATRSKAIDRALQLAHENDANVDVEQVKLPQPTKQFVAELINSEGRTYEVTSETCLTCKPGGKNK